MSFASWSLALKSAAVSVANAVASNVGFSPTVVTSCPLRSTTSAQRALLSYRNRCSSWLIAPKSPSVNDQLVAPTGMDLVVGPKRLGQLALDPIEESAGAALEIVALLPANVFLEQASRFRRPLPAKVAQCRKPTHRTRAEQIPPPHVLLATPHQQPRREAAQKTERGESGGPSAPHGQAISRRADNACAIVTPSAYSRSP